MFTSTNASAFLSISVSDNNHISIYFNKTYQRVTTKRHTYHTHHCSRGNHSIRNKHECNKCTDQMIHIWTRMKNSFGVYDMTTSHYHCQILQLNNNSHVNCTQSHWCCHCNPIISILCHKRNASMHFVGYLVWCGFFCLGIDISATVQPIVVKFYAVIHI